MSEDYRVRTAIPKYLRVEQDRIEKAAREAGYDFFPIVYEMVSSDQMNELASRTGFPERFPHWSFGMEYDRMSKQSEWSPGKILEMVINSNPAYGYLQNSNSLTDQKSVLLHVAGHSTFFKQNYCFRSTDFDGGETTDPVIRSKDYNPKRNWIDRMANHAVRIRRIIDKHGVEKVEQFIDNCMSIENMIDIHAPFMGKRKQKTEEQQNAAVKVPRFKNKKDYMESFINNEQYVEEQKKKLEEEKAKAKKFPEHPEKDVMGFLLQNAPLETWERDILECLAVESHYWSPQRQTKCLNEGLAMKIQCELAPKVFDSSEIIDAADLVSSVVATNGKSLNPYSIGLALLRNIEERWNKGQHGREWEECDSLEEKLHWDTREMRGREKVMEVIRLYNDLQAFDTFITPDFAREQNLFSIAWSNRNERFEIETREFAKVKEKLLFQLTNGGNPFIHVEDANHDNRGELMLKHEHAGMDLRQDYAKEVLRSMVRIWKRPCSVVSIVEEKTVAIRFDGKEHTIRQLR